MNVRMKVNLRNDRQKAIISKKGIEKARQLRTLPIFLFKFNYY